MPRHLFIMLIGNNLIFVLSSLTNYHSDKYYFIFQNIFHYIVLLGVVLFLSLSNTLSRNIRKRILQIDTVIDSTTKVRGVIDALQCTDIGYGSAESKRSLESINVPRSLMVGTIESNRVNLRIIFIGLCSILLFL